MYVVLVVLHDLANRSILSSASRLCPVVSAPVVFLPDRIPGFIHSQSISLFGRNNGPFVSGPSSAGKKSITRREEEDGLRQQTLLGHKGIQWPHQSGPSILTASLTRFYRLLYRVVAIRFSRTTTFIDTMIRFEGRLLVA